MNATPNTESAEWLALAIKLRERSLTATGIMAKIYRVEMRGCAWQFRHTRNAK